MSGSKVSLPREIVRFLKKLFTIQQQIKFEILLSWKYCITSFLAIAYAGLTRASHPSPLNVLLTEGFILALSRLINNSHSLLMAFSTI